MYCKAAYNCTGTSGKKIVQNSHERVLAFPHTLSMYSPLNPMFSPSISLSPFTFLISGSIHSMNSEHDSASPCFTDCSMFIQNIYYRSSLKKFVQKFLCILNTLDYERMFNKQICKYQLNFIFILFSLSAAQFVFIYFTLFYEHSWNFFIFIQNHLFFENERTHALVFKYHSKIDRYNEI